MLKKIFSLILCMGLFLSLNAQDTYHRRFASIIEGKLLEMSFTYKMAWNGQEFSGAGKLQYQDGMFVLQTADVCVYNDGIVSWTLMQDSMEALVENALKVDLSASPRSIFEMLGHNLGNSEVSASYRKDGMLSSLNADLGNRNSISVKVDDARVKAPVDKGIFSYSGPENRGDWVITDLR